MRDTLPDRVRIGLFEVDLRAGELRSPQGAVFLQDQPLFVLRLLVERAGEIVTRDEIRKKLWPNDTIVDFDHGINTAIRKLRQALGDSADHPKYLETIARRGYRLLAAVERISAGSNPQSSSDGALGQNVAGSTPPRTAVGNLIGKKASHYRVLGVIGGGGMGLVYEAEDLKLGRRVALKFLPDELAWNPVALQRFEREARAASSLDHPNICTIYEVEEHEDQPFIVMQLLQGETLRDHLASLKAEQKEFPLAHLLAIAEQICCGLEAAHASGIVHRDIKPANIFLTKSGQVKILDFGLAKLDSTSRGHGSDGLRPEADGATAAQPARTAEPDATLTRVGIAMGTAGYMSPEQVRGERLDARTDIFSFGLVLYEMATGQRAFSADSALELQDAILKRDPVPACECNASIPPKLQQAIDRALEKDRECRYQRASDLREDLIEIRRGLSTQLLRLKETEDRIAAVPRPVPETTPVAERQLPAHVGWSRRAWAIALTFALFWVAMGTWWKVHRSPAFAVNDTAVLADFVNKTGDPVFDDALKMALNAELMQSPYLHLLSPDKLRRALKQMNRPPGSPLTAELARDVCVSTNSKAFIDGSIADAGNHYRLELNATDCHSGKRLASSQEDVPTRNEVIKRLGLAGEELRRELGEPRAVLDKFRKPLDEATSASPEALQASFQAVKAKQQHGDVPEVFAKLNRAIELDPNYAQAYLMLGISYLNAKEVEQSMRNIQRAYELRYRLTERARFQLETFYYIQVTGEAEKSLMSLKQWAEEYPMDNMPHADLAEDLIANGQYEAAIKEARESVRLVPSGVGYVNLVAADVAFNRLSQAKADFDEAIQLGQTDGYLYEKRYTLAFLQNDAAGMQEQLAWAKANPAFEYRLLTDQADTEAYYGRLAKSQAVAAQAVESARKAGDSQAAVGLMLWDALRGAEAGDAARARQRAAEALASSSDRDIQAMAALVLARTGDVGKAEALVDDLHRQHPVDTWLNDHELPAIRAAIELQRNNPAVALEVLRTPPELDLADLDFRAFPPVYPIYLRGEAYLKNGQGQRAAAEFQKILDHPGIVTNFITGGLARLGLARAYALQMRTANQAEANAAHQRSLAAYKEFLTLWKDADPNLPIYQQAKTEYKGRFDGA
jgi:serine/threonine protein kinase/Flp pilus assembly protein TadD